MRRATPTYATHTAMAAQSAVTSPTTITIAEAPTSPTPAATSTAETAKSVAAITAAAVGAGVAHGWVDACDRANTRLERDGVCHRVICAPHRRRRVHDDIVGRNVVGASGERFRVRFRTAHGIGIQRQPTGGGLMSGCP